MALSASLIEANKKWPNDYWKHRGEKILRKLTGTHQQKLLEQKSVCWLNNNQYSFLCCFILKTGKSEPFSLLSEQMAIMKWSEANLLLIIDYLNFYVS